MLMQYQIQLESTNVCTAEFAYPLYSALLSYLSPAFATQLHENQRTPIRQYLRPTEYGAMWNITALDAQSYTELERCFSTQQHFILRKFHTQLQVRNIKKTTIPSIEALFALVTESSHIHQLHFQTPTAFHSKKTYVVLPQPLLILQSISRTWEKFICPIEDTENRGLQTLAEAALCTKLDVHTTSYPLKTATVPGVVGSMTIKNCATGFHQLWLDALLYLAQFTGVGIKTALGMGGVTHTFVGAQKL